MVAAAVEVGAAPLAQVNTFLLWKRAGVAGCWHIHTHNAMGECKSCQCQAWALAGPLGRGLVPPQRSSRAHGHSTAQGWRRSRAERAWTGLVQS